MFRTALAAAGAAGILVLSTGTAWAGTPRSVTITATVVPGTTTYAHSTAPLPTPGPDPTDAVQMLAWANQTRANAGVGQLVMRDAVVNIGQGHSNDMASKNDLFHNDNFFTEAVRILVGGGILGENVAMASTIANAQAAFLASPHHLANMVDARFNAAGFAITIDNAGMYWVTEDFVQELSAPHAAPVATRPIATQPVVVAPTPPAAPRPAAPRSTTTAPADTSGPAPHPVAAPTPAPVRPAIVTAPGTVAPAPHSTSTLVLATPALTPAPAPPLVARPEGGPPPTTTPRAPIVVGTSVAAGLALALIARRKRAFTV